MAYHGQALVEAQAKNLVRSARARHLVGQLYAEIGDLLEVFEENRLQLYFSDLSLSHEDKLALARTLGDSSLDILSGLFEQVLAESQEAHLYAILVRAYELLGYENTEVDVHVTSCVPLTEDQKRRLYALAQRKLSVNSGRLVEKIDPSLIGGFILEANHQVIDASIRRQLQDLKQDTKLR